MGVKDCNIILYSPNNTYYPGQTISGHVEYIIFDSAQRVRGIQVEIKGAAETSWTKVKDTHTNSDGKTEDVTEEYSGKEEYFKVQYYLLGSQNGDIEIPMGSHKYPFTCTLPATLPSTFEGEFGFVRYTIKATLDRLYESKLETNLIFTVVKHFDLNLYPESKAPLRIHIVKRFCCWCCKSAPVILDVCLPTSGYCPGQTIPLDVNCENGSGATIFEIEIKLNKICTYQSDTPESHTKKQSVKVTKLNVGTVPGHTTRNINKTLKIPPLPPSNLENCGIIHIEYNISVSLIANGLHLDKEAMEPIFIGTIPPRDVEANAVTSNEATCLLASAPLETPNANMSQPHYQYNPSLGNPPYPTGNLPYPPHEMGAPIFQESQAPLNYGFHLNLTDHN